MATVDPKKRKEELEATRKAQAKADAQAKIAQEQQRKAYNARVDAYQKTQADAKKRDEAVKELAKKQTELDALQSAYDLFRAQTAPEYEAARKNSGNPNFVPANLAKQEQELLDKIEAKQNELNNVQQIAQPYVLPKGTNAPDYMGGTNQIDLSTANNYFPKKSDVPLVVNQNAAANAGATPVTTTPVAKGSKPNATSPVATTTTTPNVTFDPVEWANKNEGVITPEETTTTTTTPVTTTPVNTTIATNDPTPASTGGEGGTGGKNFDWSAVANAAMSYGIPLAQTLIGFNQLKKAGDRPVDKLSPEYQQAIDKAKYTAQLAENNARTGLSAEELALANTRNVAATNASRYFARNIAGGNAAAALNAERASTNDMYGRGLETQALNQQLKREKMQQAYDRRDALNAMLLNKQNYNRLLFGDSMNAFQQKQAAAAGLINAGLTNASDAYFANKRLAANKDNIANSNPYQ